MRDPDGVKIMAAVIASGLVKVHGSPDAVIAAKSIAMAQEIDEQVERLFPEAPGQAPDPPLPANPASVTVSTPDGWPTGDPPVGESNTGSTAS